MQAQFQAEELEELRQEFYEAETAENERRKEAEEEAKRCRTIKELRAAEADAKRMLAEKLAAEKEEEEKFKLQVSSWAEAVHLIILVKHRFLLRSYWPSLLRMID